MKLGIILILCALVFQKVAALPDPKDLLNRVTNNSNFHQNSIFPLETTTEFYDYETEASILIATTSESNSQHNVVNSSEPNEPQDFSSAKFSTDPKYWLNHVTNNSNFHQRSTSPLETMTEFYYYETKAIPIATKSESNSQYNVANSSELNEPQDFSSTKFSTDLYEAVKESQPQNFVLSPLSVRNALAMLSLGAMNTTAKEIQKALQLPANASKLINIQSNLISSLKGISIGNSGVKFVTADKIYANSGLSIKTEYQKDVKKLGGEIENVDFGKSEEAARNINSWVQEKTEGKIDKIVDSDGLDSLTSLILLNSIYFKGSWKNAFNESDTKQRPFFINASCSVNVEMMRQENKFKLADLEDANAQVILLPYQGERLSMMIYLPNDNEETSLDSLENWLTTKSPFEIQREHLNQNRIGEVSVSLPKFKIRSSLDLNEPLKKLGLGKMFDQATADFSGIFVDSGNFFVSKVSQETFIEVNEEGTEAAAVTGFEVSATSFQQTPEFTANRPFLFQIVDIQTKTVLFSGRVKNPLDSLNSSDSLDRNSQCIEATSNLNPNPNPDPVQHVETNNQINSSCVAKPEVEEMLLDFLNLLARNETETHDVTSGSRVSAFQNLMEKYGSEATGTKRATFLQSMSAALNRLERTEEKLKNEIQKTEELTKENQRLRTTPVQKPDKLEPICCHGRHDHRTSSSNKNEVAKRTTKEDQLQCLCFPPAAARISECYDLFCDYTLEWEYDVTRHEICSNFEDDVESVELVGSCVMLYREENCSGKRFRLHTANKHLGRDIQKQFPSSFFGYYSPKSIGPCQ